MCLIMDISVSFSMANIWVALSNFLFKTTLLCCYLNLCSCPLFLKRTGFQKSNLNHTMSGPISSLSNWTSLFYASDVWFCHLHWKMELLQCVITQSDVELMEESWLLLKRLHTLCVVSILAILYSLWFQSIWLLANRTLLTLTENDNFSSFKMNNGSLSITTTSGCCSITSLVNPQKIHETRESWRQDGGIIWENLLKKH